MRDRFRRFSPFLPALAGLLLGAALFAAAFPRQMAIEVELSERRALDALARVERSLAALSIGLDAVQRDLRAGRGLSQGASEIVDSLTQNLPELRTLVVIGPDGRVREDSRPGSPSIGLDLSDRAYFRVHLRSDTPETYFAAPVTSRIDGQTVFPISTAIRDDTGALVAVLVASVSTDYFDAIVSPRPVLAGQVALVQPEQDLWIRLDAPKRAVDLGPAARSAILGRLGAVSEAPVDRVMEDDQTVLIAGSALWPLDVVLILPPGALALRAAGSIGIVPAAAALAGLGLSAALLVTRRRRKRALAHAREREILAERLTTATAAADVGIWDWDIRSGHLYWSDVCMRLFGVSPEHFRPDVSSFFERVVPEHVEGVRAALDAHLKEGKPFDIACEMFHADGHRIAIAGRGEATRDAAGEPIRMLGTVRDVSLRRSLETRLLEAERIAEIGHWSLEFRTGRVAWSPQTFRLLGLEPDSVVPTLEMAMGFYHPEDREMARGYAERSAAAGLPFDFDARIFRTDGEMRFVRVTGQVRSDANGQPERVFGVFQNRTALVEKERQLEQAQRLKAFGQLAGGVAHDFNNLLAVILGNMELLEEDGSNRLSKDGKELLKEAIGAVIRGRDLTHSLLSFARTAHLKPEPTRPEAICESLARLLKRTLPANVDLALSCRVDDWLLHVDRSALEASLLNLVLNARDAMQGTGRVHIEVSRRRIAPEDIGEQEFDLRPGPYVAFAVRDDGPGIEPDILSRVFEPFFTTKEVGAGSGLGLSRVKGFAEQSGGTARIESAVGQGTCVTLLLPAVVESAGTEADPDATPPTVPLTGLALVVEDNDAVRRILVTQLSRLGLSAREATSGDRAGDMLDRGERFDLLVTDLVMPGILQGPDLASLARRRQPDLPVIFVSGYPGQSMAEHAGVRPQDACLMKPVSIDELRKAVAGALSRPVPADPPSAPRDRFPRNAPATTSQTP